MMRSAVLVCGLCVAAGAAMAQDQTAPPPPPPPAQAGAQQGGGGRGMMDPGQRSQMMKERLNLSEDQTTQVKAIFEENRTKMEAVRANSSLSQDDRRSQMMSIRKGENDKVEGLLTADQKTKYEAMQQEMRGRMRGGNGGGTPQTPQTPQPQN